jgi:UDP-N-acetyl-D-glucosamine dehydrogenase
MCVPTPLAAGRVPDLTYITETSKTVARHLHAGQLIVLESTTYPGTTEEVVLPILSGSGLQVGEEPEREDPANSCFSTRTIPKVVGGISENCLAVALAAYGQIVERTVRATCARAAEAAKLLENIYRCVNVALVNELKLLLEQMDIDVWEVIELAATKPFGFTPFYPGPGLGGHCIPVDPFYLSWKARQYELPTRFIELAGEVNAAMPTHVVERLGEAMNERGKPLRGANILLIGVSYKRDVDDIRESPALAIIKLLDARLAHVNFHDPHVPLLQSRQLPRHLASVDLTRQALLAADAVVIVTDHSQIDYGFIVENAQLVIDTRGVTRRCSRERGNVIAA